MLFALSDRDRRLKPQSLTGGGARRAARAKHAYVLRPLAWRYDWLVRNGTTVLCGKTLQSTDEEVRRSAPVSASNQRGGSPRQSLV